MRKHVGEKPHSCKQYDYTSTFLDALQIHMMTNTDEKEHKFDQFKLQIRTRTGEEPYRCIQCDCTSTRVANLHTHMMTLHTEVRPSNCDLSMKTFTQNS